jgi:hypothetical protein
MTIPNQTLDDRLNQLQEDTALSITKDAATEQVIQDALEGAPSPFINEPSDPIEPSIFTNEEPTLVAGIGTKLGIKAGEKAAEIAGRKVLKETLEVPGTKVQREIQVGPATQRPKRAPTGSEAEVNIPDNPTPIDVKPVTEGKIKKVTTKKQEIQAAGVEGIKPPELRISTVPFDDDSLKSTVQATTETLLKNQTVTTKTVQEMFDAAIERGIPEQSARQVLAGEDFASKVGGSELATRLAGFIKLHDDSATYLDDLMNRYVTEGLNDVDKLNLRQQLAYHDVILKQMSGIQTDVARSLNVFKRAKEMGPALKGEQFQALLDETADENVLRRFAEAYVSSPKRKGKNDLIKNQKNVWDKLQEGMWYTFQSNLLNDVKTWVENLTGSIAHGTLMSVEDGIQSGFTKRRLKAAGEEYVDGALIAGWHGWRNGMLDGLESASNVVKTGKRAGYKGEARENPLSAEYLSDTSVTIPFTSKELLRTGELKDTFMGGSLDSIGFITSISFRALGSGDELVSSPVARMALHREAYTFAVNRINELQRAGKTLDEANILVQDEVVKFVREQPADIYNNVEEIRKLISFSYDFDKSTRLGQFYNTTNQVLNLPIIKTMVPFSGTLTKIFDQGASRIPGMNFISPQFYKDWERGGIYRDRAKARLATGTTIASLTSLAASDDWITGKGPTDPGQRAAWQKLGRQEYSFKVPKSWMSLDIVNKLKGYTEVNEANDAYYVSYKRFDQIAQVMAVGADFADTMKFADEDPNSSVVENYVGAIIGANAEYLASLNTMQFVGDLIAMGRGKFEDGGEKMLNVFEAMSRQVAKSVVMGTPVVGLATSTASAHVARLIDRPATTKMADEIIIGRGISARAEKVYQQAKNELLGRIPVLRGDLTKDLDNAGREKFTENTVLDLWVNAIPFVSATATGKSEMDEVLFDNKHGINMPSRIWDGVSLNAEQYNDYKKLYGQKVKITQYSSDGTELGTVNMEKAIPLIMKDIDRDREARGETPMPPGDKRKEIDRIITMYRKEAKRMMVGDLQKSNPDLPDDQDYDAQYSGKYTDQDGNEVISKYQDLTKAINKNRKFVRFSTNP